MPTWGTRDGSRSTELEQHAEPRSSGGGPWDGEAGDFPMDFPRKTRWGQWGPLEKAMKSN